jgi:hypothetical protein
MTRGLFLGRIQCPSQKPGDHASAGTNHIPELGFVDESLLMPYSQTNLFQGQQPAFP